MKAKKKETILVVDDNPANLAVLFESLRRANFKVLIAEDGQSALARIRRMRPDLILLDVVMPDMDGFQLCRRLSEEVGMTQIPVIFLSAMTDTAAKIKALNLEAVDYVTKPFQPKEVVARVERHLMLRNLQRSLSEKNEQLRSEIVERQRVEALLANVVAMSSTLERDALLPFIVERAKFMVKASCCSLLMPDQKSGQLLFVAAPEKMIGKSVAIDQGIIGRAFSEGTAQKDGQLAVPLRVAKRTIGVLLVKRTLDFSDYECDLLLTLSHHAAMALENARLYEKAQQEIRERKEAENTLQQYTKQLQLLAQQVISVQEEERQRLSRELHDEAGQALTALQLSLSLIHSDLQSSILRQRLSEAIDLTNHTHEQLRLMAHNLRPPELDNMPLSSTLFHFCRRFSARTGLSIDYWGDDLPFSTQYIKLCLYRFLQESLSNIAKHARATQVYVTLRYDSDTVSLSVDDNGIGFELPELSTHAKGIGLLGMRERIESLQGRLEINSVLGEGSLLVAHLPWHAGK